jgi:hypothetical protein
MNQFRNLLELMKKLFCWFLKDGPTGLGQLCVGIAALLALYHTKGILEDVNSIRQDAAITQHRVEEFITEKKQQEAEKLVKATAGISSDEQVMRYIDTHIPTENSKLNSWDVYIKSDTKEALRNTLRSQDLSQQEKISQITKALMVPKL